LLTPPSRVGADTPRLTAEYDADDGSIDGDRFAGALTRGEVHLFVAESHALVSGYSRPPDDAPPDSQQMAVRLFILPEGPMHRSEGPGSD
jgi:hypothetical protein